MMLDKVTHFLAGAVIVLALGYVLPIFYAMFVAVIVGALKELYDSFHPATHTADMLDFVSTVAGGLLGVGFILLVPTLKNLLP